MKLLFFFLCFFVSIPASASTGEVNELLDAWQMEDADASLKILEAQHADEPEVIFLRGRWLFFQGDYDGAIKKLEEATNAVARPSWVGLLELVRSTQKVTAKYKKFTSPSKRFRRMWQMLRPIWPKATKWLRR